MPTPIWSAEIDARGKLTLDLPAKFKAFVEAQKQGHYELILRGRVQRVSKAQRGYYRGVVVPLIADAMGCSNAECHEALKAHLLSWGDGPIKQIKSTEGLGSIAYARYVDDVVRLAQEFYGLAIPGPNEAE